MAPLQFELVVEVLGDDMIWTGEGVRTGITIYDNKILFQCGSTWHHPGVNLPSPSRPSQVMVAGL